MRSTLPFLLYLSLAEGRIGHVHEGRELSPRALGALHQDAFEKMGIKYAMQKPDTRLDVMFDVIDIVSPHCPQNDSECLSEVHHSAAQQFESTVIDRYEILYPDTFDDNVKHLLDSVYSVLDLINEENLDQVIDELHSIEIELENLPDVDERSLLTGRAGLSIAIESTKLWHSAVTDSNHPFHDMIGYFSEKDRTRRTQVLKPIGVIISKLINPDYNAAIQAALTPLQPVELVRVLSASISASSSTAIVSQPVVFPNNHGFE